MLEYSLSCRFMFCDARMRLHSLESVEPSTNFESYIKAKMLRVGLNRRKRNITASTKDGNEIKIPADHEDYPSQASKGARSLPLHMRPESLMAKIMKARYFKNSEIMKAQRGSNPSFIWRSIIWSRDVIAKGIMWRVGDGRSISAFQDAWILGLYPGQSSVGMVDGRIIKVADFIGSDGSWDVEAIGNPEFEVRHTEWC